MKAKTHHMAGVAPTGTEVQPEQCAEPRAPAEVRLPMLEQNEPTVGFQDRLRQFALGMASTQPTKPVAKRRPQRSYGRSAVIFD